MRVLGSLAAIAALILLPLRPSDAQSRADSARPVSPASVKVATELLEVTRAYEVMRATMSASFDAQVEQQPEMAAFRPVMEEWVNKYITWDVVGPRMATLYAEMFTEAELRELLAFYKTPLGKRLAEATPELGRRGAEIGAEIAAEHMGELQMMVMQKATEMQKRPPQDR